MAGNDPEDRIVKLEFLVTHLEHELASMSSVLREQQKQIDALQRAAARLDDRLSHLAEDEHPGPGDERPPHY